MLSFQLISHEFPLRATVPKNQTVPTVGSLKFSHFPLSYVFLWWKWAPKIFFSYFGYFGWNGPLKFCPNIHFFHLFGNLRFLSPPKPQKYLIFMFSLSIPFIHTTTDYLRAKIIFLEKWAWSYRRLKKAYFHYLVFLTLMVPLKIDIRYSRNVFIVVSWEDWTLVYISGSKVSQLNKSPSPNSRFHNYIYWKLAIWRRSKKWVRHAFTKNNELYLKI